MQYIRLQEVKGVSARFLIPLIYRTHGKLPISDIEKVWGVLPKNN
jgi:hypothetical protein